MANLFASRVWSCGGLVCGAAAVSDQTGSNPLNQEAVSLKHSLLRTTHDMDFELLKAMLEAGYMVKFKTMQET